MKHTNALELLVKGANSLVYESSIRRLLHFKSASGYNIKNLFIILTSPDQLLPYKNPTGSSSDHPMRNIFAALPCVRQAFLLLLAALPGICQAQAQADFFMDRSGGCSPLTVAFTNTATGASANAVFKWDLGNGNISYLRNPSAIYREEKMYRVTLTVTDGTQTSNKTKMVTVYKKPVADFSAVAPKVCLPASAQFTSNATPGDGNITGYRWDFGDGTTQQGFGNGISHHYTYEQIPAVSLMVTNSYGCQASITKQNTVEILPPIKPLFTSDKTLLCSLNESIQLTNNSTGPGTLSYLWDFGDGTTSTLKNPAHRFVQKGLYSVRLTVSNTVGCSVTGNSLSINAAYFNTSFTARPLCREVSFTSSSYLSPTATLWKFGDGSTSNSFYTASHVYAVGGTYNVTLINKYGACKDTIVRPVTVQELVAFNSDITMPPSVCQGSSTTFTSTSSVPPGRVTWDFGDGAIFNTSFPAASHSYSQPGTYIVKMVNTFGTCSETVSKTINVHALPTPVGFIANYGGICGSPVTVQFSDTTQGATGWQWYLDYQFNPPFSTQQNASLSFTSDGFHTVYLTVTNANGCKKTVSKIVNIVSPSALIYYTYSSSPRGLL
jgi:PKD repeat protein